MSAHDSPVHTSTFSTDTSGLEECLPPPLVELADGDAFDLRIAPVVKQLDNNRVRMLAYNGSIPGPTLRVPQGSEISVRVHNDGDVEATVHWHGLRLDNEYDGVPHETQAPIPCAHPFMLVSDMSRDRRPGSPEIAHSRGRSSKSPGELP